MEVDGFGSLIETEKMDGDHAEAARCGSREDEGTPGTPGLRALSRQRNERAGPVGSRAAPRSQATSNSSSRSATPNPVPSTPPSRKTAINRHIPFPPVRIAMPASLSQFHSPAIAAKAGDHNLEERFGDVQLLIASKGHAG